MAKKVQPNVKVGGSEPTVKNRKHACPLQKLDLQLLQEYFQDTIGYKKDLGIVTLIFQIFSK